MIGEEIRRPFPRKLGGFGIVIGSGFVEEGMPRFVPVGFERHLALAQLGFQCPGLLGRKRLVVFGKMKLQRFSYRFDIAGLIGREAVP